LLPAGHSGGVEDADEGTDEVVGVSVGAEITAADGALDGGYEGAVDERAGAFEQANGAASTVSMAGRMSFFSAVVDEEKHPARSALSGGMVAAKRCSAAASFSTSLR
jgi:hypothetical protein